MKVDKSPCKCAPCRCVRDTTLTLTAKEVHDLRVVASAVLNANKAGSDMLRFSNAPRVDEGTRTHNVYNLMRQIEALS